MVVQACNPSTRQRQGDQELKVILSYIANVRSASRGPMFKKRQQQRQQRNKYAVWRSVAEHV